IATSNAAGREHFRGVRIPIGSVSIAAAAVRERRTIAVDDAVASKDVKRDLVDAFGEKSLLAIPLAGQERPVGVFVIDETRHPRSWSHADVERAELVAQQLAAGLANARLYEEVRRRSLELERAQQELGHRERLAALGRLAATLAHEV